MPTSPTEKEIEDIRRNFRRCREGTAEAIVELRRTGDPALVSTIVRGIVWRYLGDEARPILEQAAPETALSELGVDSLTMMEIVLDVQEALDVLVEDADLKDMKTIGDVTGFLERRYAERPPAG